MRVETTTANDVTAGRGQRHTAAARQQRTSEQDRRANLLAQDRVEVRGMNVLRVQAQTVRPDPFRLGTHRAQQQHQCLDVTNPRDILQTDLVFRQQRRSHDRQRGVLVSGRTDRSRQSMPTFHHIPQTGHAYAPERGQYSA